MKPLLAVTGLVEGALGLALLLSPPLVAVLLLGTSLDAPAAVVVGRMAGAALLALGTACWLAQDDGRTSAARGLVAATLLYCIAAIVVLAYAGIMLGMSNILLWSVVIVHKVLGILCIMYLRSTSVNTAELSPQFSDEPKPP